VSHYQVLARKWRPQRFDDVVGQRGVTQTLRNAIARGRIAQSFVFAGPRGVGKTTTARILARALSCAHGPTVDPCGVCDACVEIAQGRDIDVLEIDAATNTQVDKVREVIIAGLGMAAVRNRYKIFIIDEVHRLSQQAFDALLKSIEEPPPHVVFMMATTELEKVPPTIQSRSQVFELKTIGIKQIADQLRKIVDAEQVQIDDPALLLVARAGDGSMRDAQSALDQVIAFAGGAISPDDVATVLGLVRRDLLLDITDAVAREDGPAIFALAARAVESGYDLRLVVRELARLIRDLLVLGVDPSRITDPEIAADGERDRLVEAAARFSAEDLMRAFEVLTRAETDLRASMQPRYHLEMALLRWMHLRRLVPLTDLIDGLEKGGRAPSAPVSSSRLAASSSRSPQNTTSTRTVDEAPAAAASERRETSRSERGWGPASRREMPAAAASEPRKTSRSEREWGVESRIDDAQLPPVQSQAEPKSSGDVKSAFLAEIQQAKTFFYRTVIARARRIDLEPARIVFTFDPQDRALRLQFDQLKPSLVETASRIAGRRMGVVAVEDAGATDSPQGESSSGAIVATAMGEKRQAELRERALANSGVQAMLDVFAAEIKEVEEM
jgi:DNA polymerase-3 subunit gamma/tau